MADDKGLERPQLRILGPTMFELGSFLLHEVDPVATSSLPELSCSCSILAIIHTLTQSCSPRGDPASLLFPIPSLTRTATTPQPAPIGIPETIDVIGTALHFAPHSPGGYSTTKSHVVVSLHVASSRIHPPHYFLIDVIIPVISPLVSFLFYPAYSPIPRSPKCLQGCHHQLPEGVWLLTKLGCVGHVSTKIRLMVTQGASRRPTMLDTT